MVSTVKKWIVDFFEELKMEEMQQISLFTIRKAIVSDVGAHPQTVKSYVESTARAGFLKPLVSNPNIYRIDWNSYEQWKNDKYGRIQRFPTVKDLSKEKESVVSKLKSMQRAEKKAAPKKKKRGRPRK